MKVNEYVIIPASFALLLRGFILNLEFLWFVMALILVLGLSRFILDKIYKSDQVDQYFDSILSPLYDRAPDVLYYAFRLRVPIISGLILIALPFLAQFVYPQFLQNLFVIESDQELMMVMVFTTLTASFIVSLLKTILVLKNKDLNANNTLRIMRSGLTVILIFPTLGMLWLNDESSFKSLYGWTGLLFSSLIFLAFQIYEYRDYIKKKKLAGLDKVILLGAGGIRTTDLAPNANNKLNYRLKYVGIHIGIGLVVYIVAILVNWPRLGGQIVSYEWQAPTLLYALLIIWVLTLFVGLITLVFDNSIDKQLDKDTNKTSRLYNHTFYWPVILFLIIFSASGYGVENVDHIFKLLDSQVDSHEVIANYQQDFQKAVWNRLCEEKININNKIQACNNNKEQSLVVVSASGGGIQASGWMAQVLTGLQDKQLGIGKNFTKAITLISSASGGSVGSMYYLDQFENGVLTSNALKKGKVGLAQVVENATDDWLNAVGWGLAFPDLFRAIGLPCVLNLFSQDAKYLDRGYALEKTWQNTLGKEIPTLDSRRKEILEGKIPIPVYNTTLVENGRPFLVSPMKFVPGTMADYVNASSKENLTNALDFKTLYNNCGANGDQACDLALTTAARLSASFPYVTPMARNDRKNYIKDEKGQTLKVKNGNGKETDFLQDYHVADGGYYDNAGAFTALQWLNAFLKYNNDRKESDHYINIKKVLILQINAFPEDNLQLDQQGSKGFEVVTIGPINTLAGIRDSTQIARNHIFAQLLNDRWHDIEIKDFTISFPKFKEIKDKNGKEIPYNPPLSWRLTKNQRMNLEEAWQKDSTIRETVEKMKMFWLNA